MNIELNIAKLPESAGDFRYDPELDDVTSILFEVCDALDARGEAHFTVSGFGQDNWPVDIRTDLPVFLGQLPNSIQAASDSRDFVLDFYEQGVERTLEFRCGFGRYSIHCSSRTDWIPEPREEQMSASAVKEMLSRARDVFVQAVHRYSSVLAANPQFQTWAET